MNNGFDGNRKKFEEMITDFDRFKFFREIPKEVSSRLLFSSANHLYVSTVVMSRHWRERIRPERLTFEDFLISFVESFEGTYGHQDQAELVALSKNIVINRIRFDL